MKTKVFISLFSIISMFAHGQKKDKISPSKTLKKYYQVVKDYKGNVEHVKSIAINSKWSVSDQKELALDYNEYVKNHNMFIATVQDGIKQPKLIKDNIIDPENEFRNKLNPSLEKFQKTYNELYAANNPAAAFSIGDILNSTPLIRQLYSLIKSISDGRRAELASFMDSLKMDTWVP